MVIEWAERRSKARRLRRPTTTSREARPAECRDQPIWRETFSAAGNLTRSCDRFPIQTEKDVTCSNWVGHGVRARRIAALISILRRLRNMCVAPTNGKTPSISYQVGITSCRRRLASTSDRALPIATCALLGDRAVWRGRRAPGAGARPDGGEPHLYAGAGGRLGACQEANKLAFLKCLIAKEILGLGAVFPRRGDGVAPRSGRRGI